MRKTLSIFTLILLLSSCEGSTLETSNATEVDINTPEEVKQQKVTASATGDTVFKDGMTGKIWQNYLHLRTALVNADASAAATAAKNMTEALTSERKELRKAAIVISGSNDIETQRAAFADLSEEMSELLDGALSSGTIYQQYCPMAFDGAGANWYSEVEQIRNPYYGDKMLKCGKVVATIE